VTELLEVAIGGAIVTLTVVAALLTLSLKLSSALSRAGTLEAENATLKETDKAKDLVIAQLTAAQKQSQEALDALDAEYQKLSASAPVDGAYQRLLSQWSADRAAARGGAGPVQAEPAASAPGPDGLLDPFKA
jgi:Tfp pilus assembly protein PilO